MFFTTSPAPGGDMTTLYGRYFRPVCFWPLAELCGYLECTGRCVVPGRYVHYHYGVECIQYTGIPSPRKYTCGWFSHTPKRGSPRFPGSRSSSHMIHSWSTEILILGCMRCSKIGFSTAGAFLHRPTDLSRAYAGACGSELSLI